MGIGKKTKLTRACLICGEPSSGKLEYTVLVMGGWGKGSDHSFLCHQKCLLNAAHPRFADRFVKPT